MPRTTVSFARYKNQSRKYRLSYEAANRHRLNAHLAVHNAINRGELLRLPCEICGKEKVDAHHDDYSKPLSVRWLCRKHHLELHRKSPCHDKPTPPKVST